MTFWIDMIAAPVVKNNRIKPGPTTRLNWPASSKIRAADTGAVRGIFQLS